MRFFRSHLSTFANQITDKLKTQVPKASGNLSSSVYSRIVDLGSSVQLEVYASSYFKFVEFGRKAGKTPPFDSIKDWMKQKGLAPFQGQTEDEAAMFIALKIGRDGIKGTRFLENYLNRTQLDFADQALVAMGDDIQLILEEETKEIK